MCNNKIEDLQEKLNKISRNCDVCKAKMCGMCPNSKMKKNLKLKLKDLGHNFSSNESDIVEKLKKIFKKFFKF